MANLLTSIRLLLVVPAAWAFARPEFLSPLLLAAVVSVAIATLESELAHATTADGTGEVPMSRAASDDEVAILDVLDPDGLRYREIPDL